VALIFLHSNPAEVNGLSPHELGRFLSRLSMHKILKNVGFWWGNIGFFKIRE